MTRRQRGFTLIEIVIAFVLLSLILATSYQIFSTGMQRAGDLDDYSRALEIAQTQLAQAGVNETFDEGQTSGQSDDQRFRWTVSIAAFDDGTDPAKRVLATNFPIRIAVHVTWRSGTEPIRHPRRT